MSMFLKKLLPLAVPLNRSALHVNQSIKRFASEVPGERKTSNLKDGPPLSHFFQNKTSNACENSDPVVSPYITRESSENIGRKVYLETYGCQMNVNDTEIINAILEKAGFEITNEIINSDVIFIMTCSIREGAEKKIWKRLEYFRSLKRKRGSKSPPLHIGVLGCMAERLKHKLIEAEKVVDIVAGPDSYRDLPNLLSLANEGQKAVNVMLSVDETYADIMPVRTNPESKSAFVSIMRGCDNLCTYCIVPFTRGNERSRPVSSILDEVRHLSDQGYKEVTLLGQNVNSYRDITKLEEPLCHSSEYNLSRGFTSIYKNRNSGLRFADLLAKVADIDPEMRIGFTSPHPKDFPDPVLEVIKEKPNIYKVIHLPAQSGNSVILERMRRGHTREAYLELISHIQELIPEIAFTSDFICGFCGETEEAHEDTLSLVEKVGYEFVYVFPYSMRNKTAAFHTLRDDVPTEVKKRRAEEVHDLFRKHVYERHKKQIGEVHLVLVTGPSKRSDEDWCGKNDWNTKVIFPRTAIPVAGKADDMRVPVIGDYVAVRIDSCSSQVLKGQALFLTTLQEFARSKKLANSKNIFKSFECKSCL